MKKNIVTPAIKSIDEIIKSKSLSLTRIQKKQFKQTRKELLLLKKKNEKVKSGQKKEKKRILLQFEKILEKLPKILGIAKTVWEFYEKHNQPPQ